MCDKYTGCPKGIAYIEFSTMEGKDKALELNESLFNGRQLKIEDKRKNVPFYKRNVNHATKANNVPHYSYSRQGALMGRYLSNRNFKPY